MEASEGRRIQTTLVSAQINHPRINGLLGIEQDKCVEKENTPSQRFSLDLFLPDDKSFPEFDYQALIKEMGGGVLSDDMLSTFDDPDDASHMKALAQKFEEKYGSVESVKKSGKKKQYKDEFVDAGYGYDDTDTFIDNSEAYDEVVPSDWTTEHGGFYINQGNLDFKPLPNAAAAGKKENSQKEESGATYKKKKKKKLTLDGKKVKTPKELSTQKKKKQLLNKEKQRKRQESLQKAQKILQKSKKPPIIQDDSSQDIPLAKLSSSFEDNLPLAKIVAKSSEEDLPLALIAKSTSFSLQKVTTLSNNISSVCVSSTTTSTSNAMCSTTLCNVNPTYSSSNDIQTDITPNGHSSPIHSNTPPLSTKDVTTSDVTKDGTASCVTDKVVSAVSGSGDDGDKSVKVEVVLPTGLSEELSNDILTLKAFAAAYVKGKGFFTAEVNKVLLSFARACRKLSPKIRNAIYDHLLSFLPCARDTLVKRCRRLIVQHQRDMEDEPIRMLKQAIDGSMAKQKKNYENEVAQALQEQAREQIKQTGVDPIKSKEEVKDDEVSITDEEKKTSDELKKNFPKKKYVWNDEIRGLLCEVVKVRVGLYKMSKSKSMTAEEYIKDFLESEIRKLWPKGWMTSRILYKECRAAHQEITQQKGKKLCGGLINVTVANILKSGPKAVLTNTSTSSLSAYTMSASSSLIPTTTLSMCNGMVSSYQTTKLNSQPANTTTFKTIIAKPVVTIIASKGNVKLALANSSGTLHPTAAVMPTKLATSAGVSATKLLTITTSATTTHTMVMSSSNVITSNASSYTLPKTSTAVTWNNTSLISTPASTSPHKLSIHSKSSPLNTPNTNTRLTPTVKIVTHVKARTSTQPSTSFSNHSFSNPSKTIIVKTEPPDSGGVNDIKSPSKVDILSISEGNRRITDKGFLSPPLSTPITPTGRSMPVPLSCRSSVTPTCRGTNTVFLRTTTAKVPPYAVQPTFIRNHSTNLLHGDALKPIHGDTIKSMQSSNTMNTNTMNTFHSTSLKSSHSDIMKSFQADTSKTLQHSDPIRSSHSDPIKMLHNSDPTKTMHSDQMKTLHGDQMKTLHGDQMKTLHGDITRTVHTDILGNDMYFRQGKRKLPVEINDTHNSNLKRNNSNSNLHTHSSVMLNKSIEGKSWSEIENDLVRLSQEAPLRKESASPVSACVAGKSPDHGGGMQGGKDWPNYSGSPQSPRVTLIHISQGTTGSPVAKTVGRSPNMVRSAELSPFDNDTIRKSLQTMTNKDLISSQSSSMANNYVLSNKQLPLHTSYNQQQQQQSGVLSSGVMSSYTKPALRKQCSQLSVQSSLKNNPMEASMMEYSLPQHPSARQRQLSISKSDHQYSTSFENNRLLSEQHSGGVLQSLHSTVATKHDVHSGNDETSPLRHSQHINQSQPVHGIHMQGKFIGLQGIAGGHPNQVTRLTAMDEQLKAAHHNNDNRLVMDEQQLKAHHHNNDNNRIIRSEQDYQAKFGTYAPRFS